MQDYVDMLVLELYKHWFLPIALSRTHEGMDNVPAGRCSIGATKLI